MAIPLWKIAILAPWVTFWTFMVLTSYCPPIRDWWESNNKQSPTKKVSNNNG